MTPDQFCYWLQGFFELKKTIDHRDGATPETMKMIEDHLQLVFLKLTPQIEIKTPENDSPDYNRLLEMLRTHPGYLGPGLLKDGITITC